MKCILGGEHEDFTEKNNTATCQLLHKSVYDNLLWTCKLYNFGLISDDFSSNATVFCGYNFLFDTGSNIMRLPLSTFDTLLKRVGVFGCEGMQDGSSKYIKCPANNLPNMYIEVGDHFLILNSTEYNIYDNIKGDSDFKKLRIQFMDVQISLIGQPFFQIFHTKFDYENKVLKFHTNNEKNMIYSYAKKNDDEAEHFDPDGIVTNWLNEDTIKIIAAVSICVAVLFIVIIFVRFGKSCCKKKHKN